MNSTSGEKRKNNRKRIEFRNPWVWVPSLYFAEGVPNVIVATVSIVMFKRLGISNTDITFYTSWLYLPWVLKFIWSPFVDMYRTKRFWIITMQLLIGAGLAGIAFSIPAPHFFQLTLAFFWLLAFSSATHDIAVDGFYMLGLNQHEQAFFVGIRSTFYRIAMLSGQGFIVILAGYFESSTGLENVQIRVLSQPGGGVIYRFTPDSLSDFKSAEKKDLHFYTSDSMVIGTTETSAAYVDSIINLAKDWNVMHGFSQNPELNPDTKLDHPSWWKFYISQPLSNYIRTHFGEKKYNDKKELIKGNIAVTWLHLSGKPGENKNLVVNISHQSGDKSFSLAEGSRLEFNNGNWNVPACLIFQIDPQFDKKDSALFIARSGNISLAWSICFLMLGILFILFVLYHRFVVPYPTSDQAVVNKAESNLNKFAEVFVDFFRKKDIVLILSYLLLYRFGEAQLIKMSAPFLLDTRESGGLGLSTGDIGLVYGTIGMLALTIGGILGGIVAARKGLKFWIWWMISAMNLPILSHLYLSFFQPQSLFTISFFVVIEQLGYGFGFTAYMLYMIYVSRGKHQTAHFAITTGFMAAGLMLPGMMSGWLQELIGYRHFFIWVILCTIPGFMVTALLKIDPAFGRKENQNS